MLFIYLLEGHPVFAERAEYLLARSYQRGDALFTSHLAAGEVLAGAVKSSDPGKVVTMRETMGEMGFTYLPFDAGAVEPFSWLRARRKIKTADAIHLACAASAGMDLFLTGDKALLGIDVPGIQFIAEFSSSIL
jgi:predicted nucleic acid-binding protein